ncbi:hypothetical protein Tco_0009800 [Tanacetum coccineum]
MPCSVIVGLLWDQRVRIGKTSNANSAEIYCENLKLDLISNGSHEYYICDDMEYNARSYYNIDGEVGNKGIARLISYLKRLHLLTDERKCVLCKAISTDYGLYMTVKETLKVFGSDNISEYIVGISKQSTKKTETNVTKGLALDVELLDRVFKVPITSVKCIPHGCRLAFSQALKTILDKGGGDFLKERTKGNTNIRQCLRKVADGHFTAVVKVLSSSGVAPYCDDTIKALEANHPYKPPLSMPSKTFFEPPLVAQIDNVFCCIKSFLKGTLCGRDALRAQHILDALCGEGSATAIDLLKAITSVVNLWLAGRYPPILAKFVTFAPLTPLLKPDNRIQPIAVGSIWRRLVSMVAMKSVGKEMSKYLSDFQFRVGVAGGAKAVLHSVTRVVSRYHNDGSLLMLIVDFLNAFNLVDRSALLHEQGDPLRPLLFALILHPLVHKIRENCKLLLHAWYLDDGIVIEDSEEVARALYIIRVSGLCLVLELNIKKTKIFWTSCNGTKLREGLILVKIWRPSLGVKILGGAISRDTGFINGLAMRRDANIIDLMDLLPQLHDPHSASIMYGYCEAFFGLRTCQSVHMEEEALFFDKGLHRSIENMVACQDIFLERSTCEFFTHPLDGESTLRRADALIFGWVGEKHACVDLTGVSPLVGLSSRGFTVGHAALKAASRGDEVPQHSSTSHA